MTAMDVDALPPSPWKNGGGTTRTIAVSPPEAGLDNFDWRVSIADVTSSGEFSLFPGIDRTILLLDGAGMMLRSQSAPLHPLTTPFEPYAFRGEDAVFSELLNGSSRDFNVMTRRACAHAEVNVWQAEIRLCANPDAAVFFCARGGCRINSTELNAGWALTLDRPSPEILFSPHTAEALIIAVLISKLEAL